MYFCRKNTILAIAICALLHVTTLSLIIICNNKVVTSLCLGVVTSNEKGDKHALTTFCKGCNNIGPLQNLNSGLDYDSQLFHVIGFLISAFLSDFGYLTNQTLH